MAESIGEIMVEVDHIPDSSRSSSRRTSKGLEILTFHEAVTEAVRRGPKASVGGKALWKLTKSDNFNDFPEGSGGLLAPTSQDADDEDAADHIGELKTIKFGKSLMFQCLVLGIIVGALAFTLLVPGLKRKSLWDLPLWKWDILLLALMSGRLISGCLVRVTLIFAERQFHLQKRLLYFTYGSKRAFQNFLWLGLVLLVWHSIFHSKLDSDRSRILLYVTKILLCLQVAALIWLLKTLLMKALASSFHVNTYFERIHEALFHQYVIETLSSKPLVESSHRTGDKEAGNGLTEALLLKAGNPRKKANDGARSFEKNEEIQKNSISAWYMKKMVHMIQHGSLLTLDEQILESDMEDASHVHIGSKSEAHARKVAKKIFLNVVKPKSR